MTFRNRAAWSHVYPRQVALWHACSFLLVLLLPSIAWLGRPLWSMDAVEQLQLWTWGAAYAVFVVSLRLAEGHDGARSVVTVLVAALGCFGAGWAVLTMTPDAPMSRGIAIFSAALGVVSGITPLIVDRTRVIVVTVTTVVAITTVGPMMAMARRPHDSVTEPTRRSMTLATALHLVSIEVHPGLTASGRPSRVLRGGAIASLDDGFVLATAHGTLHALRWSVGGKTLEALPIATASPLNREAFAAHFENPEDVPFFRVTGIAIDSETSAPRIYLAHQYWNAQAQCLTMRVSEATLDTAARTTSRWQTVFETSPCLTITGHFTHDETGGRLAWRGRRLLLSVGDHGFALDRALAQDTASDYGKILELDLAGGRTIVSLGHRNPQGLLVSRDGRIWSTEHGPQGGDEINIIIPGGNYGWPMKTYGTQYGQRSWPLWNGDQSHGEFTEPVYAFVPSIGPSAVIEVGDGPLSAWRGDLLVGSLIGQALLRMRVRDGRVIFVERMDVQRRVRDIVEARDGRLVLWTDEGDLLVLSKSEKLPLGEQLYLLCAGCHGADLTGTTAGPPLRAILGRRVATREEFAYSDALRAKGGRWSRDRLDAFLRDPNAFAKGTSMRFGGIPSRAERDALIGYLLRHY